MGNFKNKYPILVISKSGKSPNKIYKFEVENLHFNTIIIFFFNTIFFLKFEVKNFKHLRTELIVLQ